MSLPHIRIKRSKRTQFIEDYVEKHLVFDNPAYKGAVNYSRQSRAQVESYISRSIYAYQYEDEYIYITRGFLSSLVKFLKTKKIKYKIVDQTVTNPATFDLKRISTLRNYQIRATHKAIDKSSGVIKMPCGAGKTITLTNVIRKAPTANSCRCPY